MNFSDFDHLSSSFCSISERSPSLFAAAVPQPAMNRSASEWELEWFLDEITACQANQPAPAEANSATSPPASFSGATQSSSSKREEGEDGVVEIKVPRSDSSSILHRKSMLPYSTGPNLSDPHCGYLNEKFDMGSSVLALTQASPSDPGDSAQSVDNRAQAPKSFQSTSQTYSKALPAMSKNLGPPIGQTTSGSSRDESDDDELEGDLENVEVDPADVKRTRRMISNRESARRSRRRKQEQMSDLEKQVGQLKVEHSSLLKRLTDVNQKYDNAAVDNRILKADIETLRAKVKMAEETVKQATGINPIVRAMANVSSAGMPYGSSQLDVSTNNTQPIQRNTQFFHSPSSLIQSPQNHVAARKTADAATSMPL